MTTTTPITCSDCGAKIRPRNISGKCGKCVLKRSPIAAYGPKIQGSRIVHAQIPCIDGTLAHHWQLETPNGTGTVRGTCKRCQVVRVYPSTDVGVTASDFNRTPLAPYGFSLEAPIGATW